MHVHKLWGLTNAPPPHPLPISNFLLSSPSLFPNVYVLLIL